MVNKSPIPGAAATRLAELVLNRPTLTQIANEAGCSVAYVSAVAAGKKPASAKVRHAAAKILNLPVAYIFPEDAADEVD